jgi:hypothetical protein
MLLASVDAKLLTDDDDDEAEADDMEGSENTGGSMGLRDGVKSGVTVKLSLSMCVYECV